MARKPGRLLVLGFSPATSEDDLLDMFSRYGTVEDVNIDKGSAVVVFLDERDAQNALVASESGELGRKIRVNWAAAAPSAQLQKAKRLGVTWVGLSGGSAKQPFTRIPGGQQTLSSTLGKMFPHVRFVTGNEARTTHVDVILIPLKSARPTKSVVARSPDALVFDIRTWLKDQGLGVGKISNLIQGQDVLVGKQRKAATRRGRKFTHVKKKKRSRSHSRTATRKPSPRPRSPSPPPPPSKPKLGRGRIPAAAAKKPRSPSPRSPSRSPSPVRPKEQKKPQYVCEGDVCRLIMRPDIKRISTTMRPDIKIISSTADHRSAQELAASAINEDFTISQSGGPTRQRFSRNITNEAFIKALADELEDDRLVSNPRKSTLLIIVPNGVESASTSTLAKTAPGAKSITLAEFLHAVGAPVSIRKNISAL